MNLTTIENAPFVQGIIHIKSTLDDATGEIQTYDEFEVVGRHHEGEIVDLTSPGIRPVLAKHPIHAALASAEKSNGKIREIPIRMFFDTADAAIQIGYRAYSTESGKPLCSGDGNSAMRSVLAADKTQTLSELACPGCDTCAYACEPDVNCYRQVRMTVQIDGQNDDLSTFEVRSTSINTYKSLRAQLKQIESRLGGLRHVPLVLKLWSASNTLSGFKAFYCMRLEYAGGEIEAFKAAKLKRAELAALGLVDNNDIVFAAHGQLENHFFDNDSYAHAQGLGEHHGRRSGASSVAGAVTRRYAKEVIPSQSGTVVADFMANAFRSAVATAEADL